MIEKIIFLLIGTALALLITYITLIRKFNNFINYEIEQNQAYRRKAINDFNSSPKGDELNENGS